MAARGLKCSMVIGTTPSCLEISLTCRLELQDFFGIWFSGSGPELSPRVLQQFLAKAKGAEAGENSTLFFVCLSIVRHFSCGHAMLAVSMPFIRSLPCAVLCALVAAVTRGSPWATNLNP